VKCAAALYIGFGAGIGFLEPPGLNRPHEEDVIFSAAFVFILLLRRLPIRYRPIRLRHCVFPQGPASRRVFATDITLVDNHQTETHLDKDESSWPNALVQKGKFGLLPFAGAQTKFLSDEQTTGGEGHVGELFEGAQSRGDFISSGPDSV